ncbi:MAG: porin family protein [Bacteroidales bacterium]|nr:porin family protein [Bacteroidales bacterium]
MKKVVLIAVLLVAAFSFNTLNAQVKGGFKLGVDFSKLSLDYDDIGSYTDESNAKRLISPRLGFILEVPVNDYLFVQTGVFATAKGYRVKETGEFLGETYEYREMQILGALDIPINFGYKYDLGGIKLFGMVGPVISYNVYATTLEKIDDEDWDNNNDLKIGTSEFDFFKPLNIGVDIEAGVELSRFQFSVYYVQGLSNISSQDGGTFKTNVFGLAAAIKFGKVESNRGGFRR